MALEIVTFLPNKEQSSPEFVVFAPKGGEFMIGPAACAGGDDTLYELNCLCLC